MTNKIDKIHLFELINQYPTPTSFNADDVAEIQKRWRVEWETNKRQFGIYQGKGSFKLSDDWQISDEELLSG